MLLLLLLLLLLLVLVLVLVLVRAELSILTLQRLKRRGELLNPLLHHPRLLYYGDEVCQYSVYLLRWYQSTNTDAKHLRPATSPHPLPTAPHLRRGPHTALPLVVALRVE